jgi:hypothetical protein
MLVSTGQGDLLLLQQAQDGSGEWPTKCAAIFKAAASTSISGCCSGQLHMRMRLPQQLAAHQAVSERTSMDVCSVTLSVPAAAVSASLQWRSPMWCTRCGRGPPLLECGHSLWRRAGSLTQVRVA